MITHIQNFLKYDPEIVSSLGFFAARSCQLAGTIFPKIPAIIPRSATLYFNYCGIVCLPFHINPLIKTYADFKNAIKMKEWKPCLITSVKIVICVTSIFFICNYFVLSLAATVGFPSLLQTSFVVLRPIEFVSWISTIGIDIYNYYEDKKLIISLNENQQLGNLAIAEINQFISTNSPISLPLAARIIRQLKPSDLNQSINYNIENIRIKLTRNEERKMADVALMIYGYIAMGISKVYRESFVDIFNLWLHSGIYTLVKIKTN